MVRVKICGITRHEDAMCAVESGAAALGFIFAPSPRRIDPMGARAIISGLPPFVKTVGVFVDEAPERIEEIIDVCGLDLVQMHGNESPDMCSGFMPGVVKALRMRDGSILKEIPTYRDRVRGLLLDAYSEKAAGGTGRTFNWDLAVRAKDHGIPIILAGGLGPSNIIDAVSRVRPYAVDVNSGVEASPGIKDHALIRELFEKLRKIKNH